MTNDKLLIEIDKEKIDQLGLSYNEVIDYIDYLMKKRDMYQKDGWYCNGNFNKIGSLNIILSKQDWFMHSVKKWYWYDGDTGGIEDVLHLHRHGVTRYVSSREISK